MHGLHATFILVCLPLILSDGLCSDDAVATSTLHCQKSTSANSLLQMRQWSARRTVYDPSDGDDGEPDKPTSRPYRRRRGRPYRPGKGVKKGTDPRRHSPSPGYGSPTSTPRTTGKPRPPHKFGHYIRQADFRNGTLRITQPGTYKLQEDITFDPYPTIPPLYSKKYPQGDGYFLGFFAAITIEADGVTLDCNGHTIEMSEYFHMRQRFFSHIELGSRPFIPKTGPPPHANPRMTPGKLRPANNVKIANCILGRSSHHGIHGNTVRGVVIQDTRIKDFEVAGISLNDVRKVRISNVDVGPSMRMTFSASLSQAIFLDHMTNTVGMGDPVLKPLIQNVSFTLRGKNTTAAAVYEKLNTDLNMFLDGRKGDLAPLIGPLAMPDGSAIYGIVIHKSGPAIGDFGSCPMKDYKVNNTLAGDIKLHNIRVFDLAVTPEAWISFSQKGKPVMGPAGAVFRATHLQGPKGEYVGNPLTDAMIATQHVLKKAESGSNAAADRAHEYFEAAFIPDEMLDWARSGSTKLDFNKFSLSCKGDSMSHFNKGVVGVRLEYVKYPQLSNIDVANLANFGGAPEDESMCKVAYYKGNDVRAVKLTNTKVRKYRGKWPYQVLRTKGLVAGHKGKVHRIHNTKT